MFLSNDISSNFYVTIHNPNIDFIRSYADNNSYQVYVTPFHNVGCRVFHVHLVLLFQEPIFPQILRQSMFDYGFNDMQMKPASYGNMVQSIISIGYPIAIEAIFRERMCIV